MDLDCFYPVTINLYTCFHSWQAGQVYIHSRKTEAAAFCGDLRFAWWGTSPNPFLIAESFCGCAPFRRLLLLLGREGVLYFFSRWEYKSKECRGEAERLGYWGSRSIYIKGDKMSVAQDVVLKALSESILSRHATIKGRKQQ